MVSIIAYALAALVAAPQAPTDPEQSLSGRTTYLGREVAQTMHWTGAPWLMRKTREDEENGVLLRKWLSVIPGQVVCDFGCGNGYHTLPLANAVSSIGTVFAVDLQPEMLILLERAGEGKDLNNIQFIEATLDDPKLPATSCDLILLVDVYHELSHPVRVMSKLRAALKPGGRIVLVEFRAEDPEVPIKPEHMMSKAQVVREMSSHGLAFAAEFDGLPWQHAMAFAPEPNTGNRFAPRQFARAFLRAWKAGDQLVTEQFLAPGLAAQDLPSLPESTQLELRAGPNKKLLAHIHDSREQSINRAVHELVLSEDRVGRWQIEEIRPPKTIRYASGSTRPFVAMHNALGTGQVASRVALANRMNFDGIAWDQKELAAARRECERQGKDLWSAYTVLDVSNGVADRLKPVRDAILSLAHGPGMLWLGITNQEQARGSKAGENQAVEALSSLLLDADRLGVEIALYPHHGFWVESVEDALDLCERLDHPRLGTCFNLCHFLRNGESSDPSPLIKKCGSRLFAVTINGADVDGTNWAQLIRPLSEGDFDLLNLLQTLDSVDFQGPVGLQAYGIKQAPEQHLPASMAAWTKAQAGSR